MPKHLAIEATIKSLKPGDEIAVYEGFGKGYRHTLIRFVGVYYITVESDDGEGWQFSKNSGRGHDGFRYLCPISQAKLEEELLELIEGCAIKLSVDQLERCKVAIADIISGAE